MKRNATLAASLILSGLLSPISLAGTLSDAPLFLQSTVPSNVLFPLSVEFPTAVTAAYRGSNDYSNANVYLGLFDNAKCYTYNTTDNWFEPSGAATNRICNGKWSGNFLNWATMTGLDEFRYAMTGGNRYSDTASQTVVERTYLSNQGSTSNFPQKTLTSAVTNSTPYTAGSSLTINNWNKGTRVQIVLGGSGTANCTNPTLSGSSFSCTLTLAGTGEAGSCTSWTGNGSSTTPYRCSTFGSFPTSGTPASATPGTATQGSTSGSDTVTCANPVYSSSAPNFTCTLTNSSGTSGNCSTWTGNGSSGDPYRCTAFGSFGGSAFAVATEATATAFNATTIVNQPAETPTSCSIANSSPYTISCQLPPVPSGRTASCNPSGNGSSSNPYNCTSSNQWAISGSPAATYSANANSSSTTSFNTSKGTRYYYKPTSITYGIPQAATKYYVPSYTGSATASFNYYPTYTVNFGSSTDYYVRAKVCVTGQLESNCTPYLDTTQTPNVTWYKPTGVIQKYGDQMRFGVFSYLNSNSIDNAVMRSKLKYVAPEKWTSSGTPTANANKEWSVTDGTYVANPDPTEAANSYAGAVTKSGVINYINKFGSSGSGYKTYDNVGKLYYEALKYLRGLQPTSDFYSIASSSNNDGFPVITTWDDPVQYSCQKNFIIAMGDTHTWCDKRLPGGTFSTVNSTQCDVKTGQLADKGSLASDTGVDVTAWTNTLGTLEGVNNLATTGTQNGASFYMSGLSYWAARNGIRPKDDLTDHVASGNPADNIKVKTYVIDVQEYGDLGVNSQYWRAAKYGGADSFDANGNPQNWSTTVSGYSGAWPSTLLPAGNPAAMIAAVNGAMSSISSQTGTGGAIGASTHDLRTASGVNLYIASYNTSGWTGDIKSHRMDDELDTDTTPTWTASNELPSWSSRKILTFNDGLNADGSAASDPNARRGVTFDSASFTTNFSPRQQAFLNTDPANGVLDLHGADRVDYIKGDSSNEGTNGYQWRARTSPLGDFINSSPVYVSVPAAYVKDTGYATYATNVATRTPMLYAGANDGMLHAFNADAEDDGTKKTDSGKEIFAYIPSAVYSRLNKLSWTNYSHKYYVDATPLVADAKITTGCNAASDANKCWRTVLVGGLGAGGQGVYALNITDPSSFSTASPTDIVMWEFTDRDDADLGYTFAQPFVRKMNDGKWAVIIGNGYNSTDGDEDVRGVNQVGTGRAYLYILYLDGPGDGNPWVLNTHFRKIELKSPTEISNTAKNGLSAVTGIDADKDGTVDYLYAGDRHGNLWKIDVSSTDPDDWGSEFGSASAPTPLFTATTAGSTPAPQQITTSPVVARHPNGGFMVLFGTGSFVDRSDTTAPFSTDSFYGIWDKNDGSTTISRSQLQKQATLTQGTNSGKTYTLQSDCTPQYDSNAATPSTASTTCPSSLAPATNSNGKVNQQLGWVLDLKNDPTQSGTTGERYISSILPMLTNGLLTFVTLTPSGDPCQGGGYDFEYALDYRTGGAFASPVFVTVSNSILSPLSINFTMGSVTLLTYPSGRKLDSNIGQNPTGIIVERGKVGEFDASGKSDPNAGKVDMTKKERGCSPFVPGRPCPQGAKLKCETNPSTLATVCTLLPPTGRIAWRQLTEPH